MRKEEKELSQKRDQEKGVSLRTIHTWLIIWAVIISGLMILFTFQLRTTFHALTDVSEQQVELAQAARELMDASDYLTEKVQRFTVQGEPQFLEEYFAEAFESKRREEAIDRMSEGSGSETALRSLQTAMNYSLELMNQEYYAMRLVIEAKGYSDYPEVLQSIELSQEDQALAPEAKLRRATELVLNDDYYALKDQIRANMEASLNELEQSVYDENASALESLHGKIIFGRVAILIQTVIILFLVWITSHLGINPILSAVDHIKSDSPIPEVGANEFRYLARAYNKIYEVYKSSLERLNFKASHDELTGAYNRAGYDLLLSSIDLSSTYMLLFDIDNFKSINDTYGHETGDKVLNKLVEVLRSNFRSDDYICRIGGDEFIVFMVHSPQMQSEQIASKIEKINRALEETSDGLPSASISVGITHGTDAADVAELFEKTDAAMYQAKQNGKRTYRFHTR